MGEARRKAMENEGPKLVTTCPVCNKAYFADGKSRLIATSYMVPMGQSMGQIKMGPSMPKIACIECGVEFFAPDALMELRKKANGEASSIIMPKVVLNG
jgi:hypothetical protein